MEKRVFNQDKTQELTEYDLTLGRLAEDKLLLAYHDAVAAATEEENALALQGEGKTVTQIGERWYEVTAVYTNEITDPETGETTFVPKGRDLKRIAATPAKEAWDETEDIHVYVPYTEQELAAIAARKAISEAKAYLSATDYIVLKIAEAMSEGNAEEVTALQMEYAEQLTKRKQARAAVNANEESIIALQKDI